MVAKTFERLGLFMTMWPAPFRTTEILEAINRLDGDHVDLSALHQWARKAHVKRCPEMISLGLSDRMAEMRAAAVAAYEKTIANAAAGDMSFGGLVFTDEWPKEAIVSLIAAWNRGITTLEMERLLQRPKNAIVGKIHRLVARGLVQPRQNPVIRDVNDPRRSVRDRTRERTPKPKGATLPPLKVVAITPVEPIRRFVMEPRILAALPIVTRVAPATKPYIPAARRCQFPMWGNERPTHVYCDAPVRTRSYCLEHSRLCYMRVAGYREQAA